MGIKRFYKKINSRVQFLDANKNLIKGIILDLVRDDVGNLIACKIKADNGTIYTVNINKVCREW
jgi:hypothetical protein